MSAPVLRRIETAAAPVAGRYVTAVAFGDLLFTAGQVGRDPYDGSLPADVDAQLHHAFDRLTAICDEAGARLENTLRATVYVTDVAAHRPGVDRAFAARFGESLPARTVIGAAELPGGALVELELVVAL